MQSWGRVFKITLRLAPVRLFQTVSRLLRIFQQQKFTSLAFRVIAYCVSKIMSRCFRVCNFRVCNFRGCNFLRLSSFGLPSRPLTRGHVCGLGGREKGCLGVGGCARAQGRQMVFQARKENWSQCHFILHLSSIHIPS